MRFGILHLNACFPRIEVWNSKHVKKTFLRPANPFHFREVEFDNMFMCFVDLVDEDVVRAKHVAFGFFNLFLILSFGAQPFSLNAFMIPKSALGKASGSLNPRIAM